MKTFSTIYIIRVNLNTDFATQGVCKYYHFDPNFIHTGKKTSGLCGCCDVLFSLLGTSSFLWVQAKVWCLRWRTEFRKCSFAAISQNNCKWQKIDTLNVHQFNHLNLSGKAKLSMASCTFILNRQTKLATLTGPIRPVDRLADNSVEKWRWKSKSC